MKTISRFNIIDELTRRQNELHNEELGELRGKTEDELFALLEEMNKKFVAPSK